MKSILVFGSLAYDTVMEFPGLFSDHILPDKVHSLNVSFATDDARKSFGGTAGNIAYTLSLFGCDPVIISTAGNDFEPYREYLKRLGISVDYVRIADMRPTAAITIITDKRDNQISAVVPGAMNEPAARTKSDFPSDTLAIVAPGNTDDMRTLPTIFRDRGIPYIFDPGQAITVLSADDLVSGITGSKVVVANDYEMAMIVKKTGMSETEIASRTEIMITTLGEEGSRIRSGGEVISVPAARVDNAADPTGAGDAYRAGLLAGLARAVPLAEAGRLGSVAASYAVEVHGTQHHRFTRDNFRKRYEKCFETYPP